MSCREESDLEWAFRVKCHECGWQGWSADCKGRPKPLLCPKCRGPVVAIFKRK